MSLLKSDVAPGTRVADARPDPAPALLEIEGLRTEFATKHGSTTAIDGMDLTIGSGEIVALVGESGSGKSATALSIMRLLPPSGEVTAGSVTFDGIDLITLPEKRMNRIRGKRISMLFQQPKATLDPTSKVGEQVAESLRLHGGLSRKAAWRRTIELLGEVGIPEPARRASSYAHQMSGGMAQRIMIAAALAGSPELLIADEPTTALDVTVQAQILKLLARLRREVGLSILLITHDLSIVTSLADRVAVMYGGSIVEQGSAREIFDRPEHPYTQALLRSSLLTPDPDGRLFAIPGSAGPRPRGDVGCRYRSRCGLCHEKHIEHSCEAGEPGLIPCGGGHLTRCWAMEAAEIGVKR